MLEDLEAVPYVITQPGTSNSLPQDVVTRSRETTSEGREEHYEQPMGCISNEDTGIYALDGVKEVTVRQRVRILELFTTIAMNNMYDVYTSTGKLLFSAYERSPCLLRFAFGRQHALTLHVVDNDGQIRYHSECPSLHSNISFDGEAFIIVWLFHQGSTIVRSGLLVISVTHQLLRSTMNCRLMHLTN
ncbi:hypothetical protein Y032_0178g639 [Ancylostoma ceylanicum]|uniref:Phospholipid scramblase n=1 Tax=Ancylostoma ceylanicum TaxID=53326 RepID=A0A016STU1_9BILA|nr:hypothetical protein Y032_0178g639 [Ancylostoma ceylanicum]